MNLEQLQKQNERIEGFKEGYQACLNWIADNLIKEQKAKEDEALNVNPTPKS